MSCSYSEIKDVIQAIFSFFGLVTGKKLTSMFVVSISKYSVTFVS